jgi:hypothetical protein
VEADHAPFGYGVLLGQGVGEYADDVVSEEGMRAETYGQTTVSDQIVVLLSLLQCISLPVSLLFLPFCSLAECPYLPPGASWLCGEARGAELVHFRDCG